MNKANYFIAGIVLTAAVGGGTMALQDEPVIDSTPQQYTETIKIIHLPDGHLSIVNGDGVGIFLNPEDLETWLNEPKDNYEPAEIMKEVVRQAAKSDPTLENTEKIDVNYEKKISTKTQ